MNAQLTYEQVIEQVANSYYQVLVQRQKLVIVESNVTSTEKIKEIIEGQFETGLAIKIDIDRTLVKLSNLHAQRQQLLNDLQLKENQLKYYMGMPIETSIQIPQSEFDAIKPDLLQQYEKLDVTNRYAYMALKQQEKTLTYQKEMAKAAYYPTLSFSGSYNYQGTGNKFPVGKGQSQGVNWFDYSSLGLNLTVPLFNGFATRAKVRQADISIKKLKEDITNTSLSLNLDFDNARNQMSNSIITLADQKENIKLAQEVFVNTKSNYNYGLATLTDLLDAETSLTESQNNYSAALLDYRLAEIQMIKSKGNLKSLLN